MNQAKQWKMLAGLAGLWMAVLGYQFIMREEPRHAPLENVSRRPPAASVPAGGDDLTITPIPARTFPSSAAPPKNLFARLRPIRGEDGPARATTASSRRKPAPAPPPAPAPAADATTVPLPPPPSPEELAARARSQEKELRDKQWREQMAQFRLLGYAQRPDGRQAFLAKGADIYVVHPGDLLDGKFIVSVVDGNGVKIQEPSSQLEHRIELKKDGGGPG
jgi:hypothetical protein